MEENEHVEAVEGAPEKSADTKEEHDLSKDTTMKSFRVYANEHGISYEAVRKCVARYEKEFAGHIAIQNRTQYLDPEGQRILDERRKVSPVMVVNEAQQNEIEELRKLVDEKDDRIIYLQDRLIAEDDRYIALQDKYTAQVETAHENERLLTDNKAMTEKLTQEKEQAEQRITSLETELEEEKKKNAPVDGISWKSMYESFAQSYESQHADMESELEQKTKALEEAQKRVAELEAEQGKYKKTIFGFFRKKK